jgi:hypothetical protein
MTDGFLPQTGGHVPYTERDLFDAVLTGRTDTIPDALRPVADTLSALRAAPAAAELSGEASARAEFRAAMGAAWSDPAPVVPSVPADTLILRLPVPEAKPRRAARHRRRPRARSALLMRPTVLLGAVAAAAVVALALGLTTLVPRSLHSTVHPGAATSPRSSLARGNVPQTSVPTLNASATAEPTPTPTPPPQPAALCTEFFNLMMDHPQSPAIRQQEKSLGDALTRLAGGEFKVWGYCARILASQNHSPSGFPNGQGDPFAPTRDHQGKGAPDSQSTGGTGSQGGSGLQHRTDDHRAAKPSVTASMIASQADSKAARCDPVTRSKNSLRTVATCCGAAVPIASAPAGVSPTKAPRPSAAHSCLATSPRRSILVSWCDSRLCSQFNASQI